jgi:hypothetical protein
MSLIYFETKIYEINSWKILRFPIKSSENLPSRGMAMIKGTINGVNLETTLEPDGTGSHWFRLSDSLLKEANITVGDCASLVVESSNEWNEPDVPLDLKNFLDAAQLKNEWDTLTTKARWAWIRWIQFTNNPATRQKRIEVASSMLKSGKKRPCCFDHSRCTETAVSKNGELLGPSIN